MTDEERPNIVLVTVDSLRADHCGFMGYEKDTTPTLDSMAKEGVVFENAIAPAPFTEQSIPPMFTGHYPVRSRDNSGSFGHAVRTHITKHGSIPQSLSKLGYATGGFTPNPHASRQFGIAKGFDEFHDFIGEGDPGEAIQTMFSRLKERDLVECLRLGANLAGLTIPGFGNQSIPVRAYNHQVLNWVTETREPFFLWMFPLEVHSPYRPQREYRDMRFHRMLYLNLVRSGFIDRNPTDQEITKLFKLYDGTIKSIDDAIQRLRSYLSPYDPVFIVTSDHGEAFGEHGNFGHNEDLYEENIRVPFFISGIEDSEWITDPISLRQIPEITYQIAEQNDINWRSHTRSEVESRVQKKKIGVRGDKWKYIVSPTTSEYYDLMSDQEEQQQLQSENVDEGIKRASLSATDMEEKENIQFAVSDLAPSGRA